MNGFKIVFMTFLILEVLSEFGALSINFSSSGTTEGDPAPGRSPGPPRPTKLEASSEPPLNNAFDNRENIEHLCKFNKSKTVGNDLLNFTLKHALFESDTLIGRVRYEVHITRIRQTPPIAFWIFSPVPGKFADNKASECGTNVYKSQLDTGQHSTSVNWTYVSDGENKRNISFRLEYTIEEDPTVYEQIYWFPMLPDCNIHLKNQPSGVLSHQDFPPSKDCKVWFPPSPHNGHGLVVELLKLNVPCSKGYIQFSPGNGSYNEQNLISRSHGNRHLCGKLEELADTDRHIYFPSSLHAQPHMHVHGKPTFTVNYRLVDHCYNITFLGRNGTFELRPAGGLQCTFKVHLPYGYRVALRLEIGDTSIKEPSDTFLTLKDAKNENVSCHGLLARLYDGSSTWSHCTHRGDAKRQIDILSMENKVILMVSLGNRVDMNIGELSLRLSYTAEPVEEIVGACDFGWVALRQFCITVLENNRLPWSQAERECSIKGGHLISIRSEHAQNLVDRLLTNSPGYREHNSYWIGASDKTHESDFRWSDGLPFSYTNWFPGWPQHQHYNRQPNDDGLSEQDCVEVRKSYSLPSSSISYAPNFMWNDRDCSTLNYFICERLQSDEPLEENWPSDCNRSLVLSREQPRTSISSPGFPRHYPDNADCDTKISAPPGYRIVLEFDELVIENEPSCSYDYLEILETPANISTSNQTLARRLCGDWNTKLKLLRYVSQGSKVQLRFSSDYSHHYGGYKLSVFMENAKQCGDDGLQMFNQACYLIVNYPEVTWLTAQQICRGIKANLASVLTQEEARFLTGSVRKSPGYRTSKLYWLGGKADPLNNFKWIDGRAMEYSGWFPGRKPSDNDLLAGIQEPRCLAVKWTPSSTPMISSGMYWRSESAAIHKGLNSVQIVPSEVLHMIGCDYMGLKMDNNLCSQVGGYICKKKEHLPNREINFNKTVNSSEGSLTTPNYPENYFNNLDFFVKIVGPERTRIVIRFHKIDIELQLECLYDYVELKSGAKYKNKPHSDAVKYCGSHEIKMRKFNFVSENNEVEIRFHSDYSVTGSGFSLSWEAIDVSACPFQTITAHSGTITSPNYPHFLLPHLDCSFAIQAPLGKRIWIEFEDIDLDFDVTESDGDFSQEKSTNNDDLEINQTKKGLFTRGYYDRDVNKKEKANKLFKKGENEGNEKDDDVSLKVQLGKKSRVFRPFNIEGLLTEGTYVSIEEILRIHLKTGDRPKGRGFKATYKTTSNSVTEEKIVMLENTTTGSILHLNYPDQPPANINLLHRFIAPLGYTISLELHHLELSQGDCIADNGIIEVYDSYSDTNGTLWKLCYTGLPEDGLEFQEIDLDIFNKERATRYDRELRSTAIHLKSFLNTLQIRQKSGLLGNFLNGSLKVVQDEMFREKIINFAHVDVESCKPNPCQNDGKCVSKHSRKFCQCAGHFTGIFCAITQCELEPCVFGTCELTNSSYKCHCRKGYTGPTCEQKRKPCEGNPCESRGTCIEKGGGFVCQCHAWWEGARCEKRMLHIPYKPLSERMLHEPFWLGLMTVCVVMSVIGLVWCAKRHFPEKIEKLLAEDDNRNRIHSLRSTSVREQLAAASAAAAAASAIKETAAVTPSPGPNSASSARSLFGRLGIRKPSILSLTSPHASGGYSPATARTFSLDDLLKTHPIRRTPSPKKKRNNSTPTKKNIAEKKQILQHLVSPINRQSNRKVSLGELIQLSEAKPPIGVQNNSSNVVTTETKFSENDPALTALNDPKLEKKVTFARLLNKVSAEMSSGSELENGILQTTRLGFTFARPSSTPPSPNINNRSPNSTSSNQGSDSFTSSDLAIPSCLSSSISDLMIHKQRSSKSVIGKQKPASADSILAMFRNFSSSSAGANLPSSLKFTPSTTPTASSPHDDIVGDEDSSSSSAHTPVSFSSGISESPVFQHHTYGTHHQSTIEVPVLDPLSAASHRSSLSGTNLLHPPTILLEIPSTINKCLSPIREMPTPLPSPMPTPAMTPVMRRSQSPMSRSQSPVSNLQGNQSGGGVLARSQSPGGTLSAGCQSPNSFRKGTASSSLDDPDNSDDKISVEIPNISISNSDLDEDDVHCPDLVIDPQAEDGLIFEEAAAMQHHGALYKQKVRPPPLGQITEPPCQNTSLSHPLVIPILVIETPSPTRKPPSPLFPGSPPPQRSNHQHHHQDVFQFPPKSTRKFFKDFDKPTSLDLPNAPPIITITCNLSEVESDDTMSPATKGSGHHLVPSGGMSYLSPFSMGPRGDQHASESNLSSSGYSSMASPGPSRCGSNNPLCPSEMEDQGPGSGSGPCLRRQSTPAMKPSSNSPEVKPQQQEQRRGRSDSETLSDDPLLESNDEGIGTDHIDEKIDEGEVKSAKELEVFMSVDPDTKTVVELPIPRVAKCVTIEDSLEKMAPSVVPTLSTSKNCLQLPSIVVQLDAPEKHLSPMSSRSESPLSDRTTGIGRFSPLFYGKNKDILPFTDSDGLYDFPSSDKVNVTTATTHKKTGRKREKRSNRMCKTPSPTKQIAPWQYTLDVPNSKDPYFKEHYKVPPPRKLSPKRRLVRTQIVSSSSSSESLPSANKEFMRSSSTPSPETIRWSSPVGWLDQRGNKSLEGGVDVKDHSTDSSPMLSKSMDFSRTPKIQKVSRLRAIGNQIRFLKRLEQSLKRRTVVSPSSDTVDSEDDSPMVTSPLLQQPKGSKIEIRKSSSISRIPTTGEKRGKNIQTRYKWGTLLQEEEKPWPKVASKSGYSE